MKALNYELILSSKSPRRSQLLSEAGFKFVIKTKDTDESFSDELNVMDVAPFLAAKKMEEAIDLLEPNKIMLTADSVVIVDNIILNKPADYEEAMQMLRLLNNKSHIVVTGICLSDGTKKVVDKGISYVTFKNMTEEEMDFYVNTYKPYDKAGSYAIQEWIGHCKIEKIEGTYSNIMGLPVYLVYDILNNWDSI
ncbi:MAG: septum formation protein Maf [Saprospiraceae bacterium]|nr:septum formation protein Maf [Saprospiraceae bacterium]